MPADKGTEPSLSVSQFVAVFNQTLEMAYPSVVITGELANFRVSKNRWVYFDLKDELASLKFFGSVYNLPGPLEDGMMLQVRGQPRLHQLYGFSVNVMTIQPAGEGSIKRAADLLAAKLAAEGLFDEARKRQLPYPPRTIGLITSAQSAAYADFNKILNARWRGLSLQLIDVQVQGEAAPAQIVGAIEQFNELAEPPEVIVLIRGGGSAEDLAAFSTEQVARAVAASRVLTLVAIGHEIDLSLAELAADQRASTPSNAAELLVPDRQDVLRQLAAARETVSRLSTNLVADARTQLQDAISNLFTLLEQTHKASMDRLGQHKQILALLNPTAPLARGYALVRSGDRTIRFARELKLQEAIRLQFQDGLADANITGIKNS